MPNHNSQWRSSPDTHICQQRAGAEQEGVGCMLRVRTRPEYPEDNLWELTWDSNPNCGTARERKKRERERENFPVKSSKTGPGPSPHRRQRGRRATARAGRQGAIRTPESASSTKLWAGFQLLTRSSWDPGLLTSARRVAVRDQLMRGDTWRTWDDALLAHPGTQGAGNGEVVRRTTHLGECTWSPKLLSPGKGTECMPNRLCLCGVPKNLNLSGLGLGSARNSGPALDSSPAEQPGAWAV